MLYAGKQPATPELLLRHSAKIVYAKQKNSLRTKEKFSAHRRKIVYAQRKNCMRIEICTKSILPNWFGFVVQKMLTQSRETVWRCRLHRSAARKEGLCNAIKSLKLFSS
jgi:hypothetical protein